MNGGEGAYYEEKEEEGRDSETKMSVAVYCGSRPGARAAYTEAATALGKEIANRNMRLVYGGGDVGLMGAVASAVRTNGGKVTGVIPTKLIDAEANGKLQATYELANIAGPGIGGWLANAAVCTLRGAGSPHMRQRMRQAKLCW